MVETVGAAAPSPLTRNKGKGRGDQDSKFSVTRCSNCASPVILQLKKRHPVYFLHSPALGANACQHNVYSERQFSDENGAKMVALPLEGAKLLIIYMTGQ